MKKAKLIIGGVAVLSMCWLVGCLPKARSTQDVYALSQSIKEAQDQLKEDQKTFALLVAWRCGRDGMEWSVFSNSVAPNCLKLMGAF